MDFKRALSLLLAITTACAGLTVAPVARADFRATPAWYDSNAIGATPDWHYRVPLTVPAGTSVSSMVRVDADFAPLLAQMGVSGVVDANSPRITLADGVTLVTAQEFSDGVYNNVSDANGNSRGELKFISQTTGAATYYVYFDLVANGVKPALPSSVVINANFETGGTGTQAPPGWTVTAATGFDAQIRPSEMVSVTSDGAMGTGQSATKVTDGTPKSGNFSYLMGARTANEAATNPSAVVLQKTFAVPATNPGAFRFNFRVEGWDSNDDGQTGNYDYIRVQLISGTTTIEVIGPSAATAAYKYANLPFSPNKGVAKVATTTPGYGRYNGFDTGTDGIHRAGMTATPGSEPWWLANVDLTPMAGKTVTLKISTSHTLQYRSWFHIDDIDWSLITGTLGTAVQAFGAKISAPNDTGTSAISTYTAGQKLLIRASVQASPLKVLADVYNDAGVRVATGVTLYNDGTHGDTVSGDSIWANDGSVVANPTYNFSTADGAGTWKVVVYAYDSGASAGATPAGLPKMPAGAAGSVDTANYFSVDEQTFALSFTPSITGTVYVDANHNGGRDGAETYTGLPTLYAKLVQAGAVSAVANVTAAGTFSFGITPTGTYTVVISTNNLTSSAVAALPAGWIGTETATGSATRTIGTGVTPPLMFGLFNGARVSGTVFQDNGTTGPNNGVQNAGEAGIPGLQITLNSGATVLDNAATDANGAYLLWVPQSAVGTAVAVNVPTTTYVSTGGSVGTTGGAYASIANFATITFTPATGVTYSGVATGMTPPTTFSPDNTEQGYLGASILYPHAFRPGSPGTLTFSLSSNSAAPRAIWNPILYRDSSCSGQVSGVDDDAPLTGSITAQPGDVVCVVVKQFIPATATVGTVNVTTITATLTMTNIAQPIVISRTDTTTVSGSAAGAELVLTKKVRNLTTGGTFGNNNSAQPGQVLQYQITFLNNGSSPFTSVQVRDSVPAYTLHAAASCGTLPAGITCAVTTQPAVGSAYGDIVWTLTGSLASTATGNVLFSATVQP